MKHCLYCGRYYEIFKECPGCGSVKFEEVKNNGTLRIEEPPKGGYKINKDNLIISKGIGIVFSTIGYIMATITSIGFIIIVISCFLFETEIIDIKDSFYLSFFLPSPFIIALFLFLGNSLTKNVNITNSKIERLKTKGVLIKNLKYKKDKNTIVVLFETEKGVKIPLKSDIIYGRPKDNEFPKYCDILFDRDDPNNYIIGFNLY